MPFEYFLLWTCIVMVGACIITPFILKRVDSKTNRRINNLGKDKR